MIALQILIDGFAISALYGLGAVGFTLMFGVSGVLNLTHGSTMVVAALAAALMVRRFDFAVQAAAEIGVLAGLALALGTYFLVVRPIQRSKAVAQSEQEIYILTGTLLWGIMIQEAIAYFFSDNAFTVPPLMPGIVHLGGVRVPVNEILIAALCWSAIGLLWLLVNRTKAGKVLLGASINPRALTLLGVELSRVYLLVWTIYGVLAGIAGVLLATFLGASPARAGQLTASAFTVVVMGGLGNVWGSLIAAYAVGYLETMTAFLISPQIRTIPSLLLLVLTLYFRPQGLLGRR